MPFPLHIMLVKSMLFSFFSCVYVDILYKWTANPQVASIGVCANKILSKPKKKCNTDMNSENNVYLCNGKRYITVILL